MIIPVTWRAALLCFFCVWAASSAVAQDSQSGGEQVEKLPMAGAEWAGVKSAAAIDATVTARDQRSWEILWQMVGEPAPGSLPDGRMAVAIFRAAEKGATRRLEFKEIVAGETALVIGFRNRLVGGSDDGTASAGDQDVAAPYLIGLVPISALPVYYVGTVEQPTSN